MSTLKSTLVLSTLAIASLSMLSCEQKPNDKNAQMTSPLPSQQAASQAPQQPASNDKAASDGTAKKVAATMDDSMITVKVKAALLAEPALKASQIDVATKDATVTLSGTVDSAAMKDRAKQIALATEGVKSVVDNMSAKTTS